MAASRNQSAVRFRRRSYKSRPVVRSVVLVALTLSFGTSSVIAARPQSSFSTDQLRQYDAARTSRQADLKSEVASTSPAIFHRAIAMLKNLDEEGVLDVWKAAIGNADQKLSEEARRSYDGVKVKIWRNEYVPEIAGISADPLALAAFAEGSGLRIRILGKRGAAAVALLTPYTLARLSSAGDAGQILYRDIASLEDAARSGDLEAAAIYSRYQASLGPQASHVRIAVIDRSRTRPPDAGYSDWLGDREDILARNDTYLAMLDVFVSDGSAGSIAAHIAETYTHRGYSLAGFFTVDEFAARIGDYFPGETFKAPTPAGSKANSKQGSILPALANGQFHSYQQTLDEFNALASANPNLAQMVQLGTTYEGRQLFALKITLNPGTPDPSKPDVLITGCHHAREWISVEPPVYFAHQLLDNYNTDDTARFLVDHLVIWIVPIVNPDGLTFSQQSPNDSSDPIRLWRKNRRPISVDGCAPGVGVDLNRNYNFVWRLSTDQPCPNYFDDVGGSDNANSETYRGPAPDSELEVQALESLTNNPSRRFVARIDYHNFGQLILYPWGYQNQPDPDDAVQSSVGNTMAQLALNSTGTSYTPEQSIDLYITTGSSTDYAYGVDHTAMPLLVELRPRDAQFAVPESEIAPIDQESWAGAKAVMEWAAGPPILQAVQAYQQTTDGNFSRLVYSAHWVSGSTSRQLVIDSRFQELDPGPIQVRLQFSKPMDSTTSPSASLGRQAPFNELTLQPAGAAEGWQKTAYANDTWIGEATIPSGGDTTDPWRLAVTATDQAPLGTDQDPSTIADYATGTGGWQGYEGDGSGSDTTNILPPSLQPGRVAITVESPMGGERLVGGSSYTVNWSLTTVPGFTPNEQQLLLSTDGGVSFNQIASGIPGSANSFTITLPFITSTQARIRVLARNTSVNSSVLGDSPANFTIGGNVGAGLSVDFVSSELLNQAWSDAASGGATASGSAELAITVKVTNTGSVPIANPFVYVTRLNKRDVLLSRDKNTPPESGGVQSIGPDGSNLGPGQSLQATLTVGLVKPKKFVLTANLFGVPIGGAVSGASAVTIWHGKPKSM